MDKNEILQDENRNTEHDKSDNHPNIRHVIIDFGECPVFGQYVKTIPFENLQNLETLCYEIIRDQDFNPKYRVFNFNKYEGMIKPGENLKLKLIYNPTIPYLRDVENFEFVDSSFNIIKIKVVGNCIGPILKASVKQLDFLITSSEKYDKKTVELKNVSNASAEFSFDYTEEHSLFKVEPSKGVIKGQRHIYIHIIFKPKKCGSYSNELYCLVWGGKPVLIQLRGVYKVDCHNISTSQFQSYYLPFKSTFGYTAYLQDCPNVKINMPPVSMSRNYIDFGRLLKSDDMNSCIEFITLRNNLENNVVVKWPDDDIFKIIPKKAVILPTMKASFRCNFYPYSKNKLYSKILTAQIKWMPKCVHGLVLPITATIKLQGHSFPENDYWIPKVEVSPQIITLPSCVPGDPSHTTFKITTMSHLPVMYTLIPPKKTNLVMKPMVGIVRTYQIVVIQLYWEGNEKTKLFNEVWHMELNNRKEKQFPICVRGEVSVPKMVVGESNVVKFKSNQPGCQSIASVPLKNISCYQIRCKFENQEHGFIDIHPKENILLPNDVIYIKFCYTGNLDHPKELKLKCQLQRITKMMELVGTSYSHTFTVMTNCRYQELCSTPTYHMFGEIQLDTFLDTEFYLFNFGKGNASFSLKITYGTDNLDCFNVEPMFGDIGSGENIKIRITGLAETLGYRSIIISCTNKTDNQLEKSDEEGNNKLFEIYYVAILPILQISSIVEHNFGPLFSKKHLWDYFRIEQLNNYLQTISRGERTSHCVYLPEVQISNETYFVTIEMESRSVYEVDVCLERKQLCECSLKEVPVNINTIKRKFDCVHREMLCMQLTGSKFYKNTQQLLSITIKYLLPGETKMCYILRLPHNRSIEIYFLIYSIPIDTLKISCYTTEFHINLVNISVRRKVPPLQIFWFYNNTGQPVTYQINVTNILYLCQREGYEVLKCINPKGTIDPYSSLPLMTKFQPIEIKEYVVNVSLICSDQIHNFYIKGCGQLDINKNTYKSHMTNLSKKYYTFPAVLSPDYIPINCIPTWSTVERIVFIKNISKDKVFQYFWEDFFFRVGINNIVELTATSKLGILQPQESQAIVIKIKTFDETCITSLQISCHFLDYSQVILHQKSLEEAIKLQNIEHNITGSVYEENSAIKHPKPFTKTIIISLHIVHTNDKHNFFTLKQQFQSNPNDQIGINIVNVLNFHASHQDKEENNEKIMQDKHKEKIQISLEQLLADFVFSNYLQEVLQYSGKLSSPLYEQLSLDKHQIMDKKKYSTTRNNDDLQKFKLKEIEKLFTRPRPSLVSLVAKDLIINGMHDILKLGMFKPISDNTENTKGVLDICLLDCKCKQKK